MKSADIQEWVGSSAAMRKRHEPSHVWLLMMNKERQMRDSRKTKSSEPWRNTRGEETKRHILRNCWPYSFLACSASLPLVISLRNPWVVCYQVDGLPRTNNDLEHFFGTARHIERRCTGRKRTSPTLVVRGSVRVVAAGASRILSVSAAELCPSDLAAWRVLRQTLDYRCEGRRKQLRFRRDPQTYLTSLEELLCRSGLPS
jgi:hypothetical protein